MLEKAIKEIKREIAMRKNVYPKLVEKGRFTQAFADERIAVLQWVLENLETQKEAQCTQ